MPRKGHICDMENKRGRPKGEEKVYYRAYVTKGVMEGLEAAKLDLEGKPPKQGVVAEDGKPVVAPATTGPTEADGLKAEVARLTKLNKEATDSIGRMAEEVAALQAELEAFKKDPIGFGAPLPTYIKFVKRPSQWDQTAE